MRLSTRIFVLFLAMSVAVNSYAVWGLLAPIGSGIMWLGRIASSNVTIARAIEWSIYGHGAAAGLFFWLNSSDGTPSSTPPIKARLVVQPNTTAKRDNPDPKRFDDASSGRDPTPKASYAGEADQNYTSSPTLGALAASQPAGTTWTVAVSGQTSYTTYKSVAIATYSGTSDLQKCSSAQSATNPGTGWTFSCPTGQSSDGQTVGIWYKSTAGKVCATGYTYSGGNCVLNDATAVTKPAGKLPCEVLQNADGTWDIDAKNPECTSLATALTKSGKTLTYAKGDGTYDTIKNNDDGSQTINTGNRTINLGPPGADGNRDITGITDGAPGNSGSGNTGTGSTGSSGSGTGNCGGPGQPVCAVSVDDTGFQGKDAQVNTAGDAAKAKLDERQTFIEGKATENGNFGLENSWIPSLLPGAAVTCQAVKWEPGISHGPLAGISGSVDIDWCAKVDVIREYYAWLVGLVTVWAIAMLFFGSNGNTGRNGK